MTLLTGTLWKRQHQSTPVVLMFLSIEVQRVMGIDCVAMTDVARLVNQNGPVHNILEKKLLKVPH